MRQDLRAQVQEDLDFSRAFGDQCLSLQCWSMSFSVPWDKPGHK